MSVSSIGASTISNQDPYDRERHDAVAPQKTSKDFDFSGAAYSAVHLPTGLLASPASSKPTLATVKADAKGAAALGALWIADKAMSSGRNILSLPDDIKTFVSQFKEALPTFGYAAPDIVHAMELGLETMGAAAKLASDVKQLGGV